MTVGANEIDRVKREISNLENDIDYLYKKKMNQKIGIINYITNFELYVNQKVNYKLIIRQ